MSYDIYFRKNGETCELPFPTPRGGTYSVDEEFNKAYLNMTCSYCEKMLSIGIAMVRHDDDLAGTFICDKSTAGEVVESLVRAIPRLSNETSDDYWEPCDGNVKRALINILTMAIAVPQDSICEVSA